MKCSICGYDENILLKQKQEAIQRITTEMTRILLEKEALATKWKIDNGISSETCEEFKNISTELKEITVSAFIENVTSFIKLDIRLQKLYEYYQKFYVKQQQQSIKIRPPTPQKRNLAGYKIADLINLYENEPALDRISKENSKLDQEYNYLNQAKTELENKNTFFIEKEYGNEVYGFSRTLINKLQELSINSTNQLFPKHRIILCPTCTALFKESASASFAITEAKRLADEDWDDDD